MKRITAFCADVVQAQKSITALLDAGVAERDVDILLIDHGEIHEVGLEHKTLVPHGAALGGAAGAAVGLGLVAVGGVPGLFAAGPVLAILQGLGGGAAAGFLVGALGGLAWWKSEADVPSELLESNAIIVGVPVSEDRLEKMREVLGAVGVERIYVN